MSTEPTTATDTDALDLLEELMRCATMMGPHGVTQLCVAPSLLAKARSYVQTQRPTPWVLNGGKRYRGGVRIEE